MNLYAYAEGDPLSYIDPLGLCGKGMWYDRLSNWLGDVTGTAKDFYANNLPWGLAGTLNTIIDLATGSGHMPATIGHLGEGSGRFSADPSWHNLSGVASDVLVVGSVLYSTFSTLPSFNGSRAAATATVPRKARTWNEFQAATKGQFATRAEAGKAWQAYKEANGIVIGTTRSSAASAQYLKSLANDYRTPSSMKQWLREGRRPPGYEIDHIKPLSIGGEDIPSNMRLQGADLHDIHHTYYRPWE